MSIIKDSLLLNIGSFIYLGSQWLISVLLVRLGGFEDAGIFSLAMSVCNVFSMIANYGIRPFQVSDINNKFSDATYVVARMITVFVAFILCIGYALLFGYSVNNVFSIVFYMLYKCIEAYCDVLTGIWQKSNDMAKVGFSSTIKGVSNLIGFFVCYCFTKNLTLSVFCMAFGSFAVYCFYDKKTTYKFVERKSLFCGFDKCNVLALLKIGLLTMLYVLSTTLFNSTPKIIVEAKLDATQLGVFSSISSPTVIITTLAVGIIMPLAPKMAEAYFENNKKVNLKYIFGCNAVIVLVGALGTVALMLIGRWVFALLFGEEILSSFTLVYYVVWASVLMALLSCYYTFFVAIRKIPIMLVFSVLANILLVVLCLMYVKTDGIYGVAYAMLIALAIQFVLETATVLYVLFHKKRVVENV